MTPHVLALLTHDEILARRWSSIAEPENLRRVLTLDALPPECPLVLIDGGLPGLPDFSAPVWKTLSAHTRLIFASSQPNDTEGLAAIDAGFSGYCHAFAAREHLRQVVEVVDSGELWVGRTLLTRLLRAVDRGTARNPTANWETGLTERERQVARSAANGASNNEIGLALAITERTVKAHLTAIFEKLGISDRLQLALRVHGIR